MIEILKADKDLIFMVPQMRPMYGVFLRMTRISNSMQIVNETFRLKYTASELPPCMVKLIDFGLYFMNNLLCCLMGRFEAEESEHLNYTHNSFYYQHTTLHGGKFMKNSIVAFFEHVWKDISYNIH